jgi:hypothetical protein
MQTTAEISKHKNLLLSLQTGTKSNKNKESKFSYQTIQEDPHILVQEQTPKGSHIGQTTRKQKNKACCVQPKSLPAKQTLGL